MNIEETELLNRQKYIFGSFFILANNLQIEGDKLLSKDGITLRQWLLTVVILQFDDRHPTLGDVARLMGTSHQNTRQLANKLQERGFLSIEKDPEDGRAIRLKLTEKSYDFWATKEEMGDRFVENLFEDMTTEEVVVMAKGIEKLLSKLNVEATK
ncbi:MarR family winged helix-turn-helix transcriptional regulator [Bacillus changyiensis]|uniref:MarR family winged helix-turn-helix transcriptional regulator n=1 Tax=Bacillus changyiensis TaxID=3004103 RepID=UPI0022E7785F|nr:MarR family transcriptional regulator [Bacillus changyiensis]MDA1478020.1 MarR family transcriptional regulator [Bacillus changyiensis]